MEWQTTELKGVNLNTTPQEIARALDKTTADTDTFGDIWPLKSFSRTGPILTIVCRSDRNHLSIIIVNDEENAVSKPVAKTFSYQETALEG